jgi:hypothetical protein
VVSDSFFFFMARGSAGGCDCSRPPLVPGAVALLCVPSCGCFLLFGIRCFTVRVLCDVTNPTLVGVLMPCFLPGTLYYFLYTSSPLPSLFVTHTPAHMNERSYVKVWNERGHIHVSSTLWRFSSEKGFISFRTLDLDLV